MPRHAQFLLSIFATILFLSAAGWPQAASEASIPLWKAQWITAPEIPQKDQAVLHFRRVVELAAVPQHFYVDVSADNQFILHVNQQRVGTGPSRSDLGHWRFETYDLAPFMHAGKNVLAATVWNLGPNAAIAQMSDRIGFLVHGRGAEESTVDTDETWDVERETALRTQRPDLEGYYAAEPGMQIDGGAFDWLWDRDSDADDRWKKAVPFGKGALRGATDPPTNWQLVSDPLPAMDMKLVPSGKVVRTTGIDTPLDFPSAGLTVAAHTKASILTDNGTLTTGYPALTAGGSGGSIRLTYAEALVDEDGHKGNRNDVDGRHITGVADQFVLGGPEAHEFMPLSWRTWRYLQIDVEAGENPVSIDGFKTWFSAFPFVEKGYFSSDDPSLKPIWDIGWRTARLDAHDTYMDTPYWERLQYVGDTRIQALISYAVAGDDRLARQAIEAFNNSRIPDGLTQSRYPSSLVQMIPTFSLLWVGMVHDFWLYRDDPEFVRAQLAGTRAVLDWYRHQQRADGMLGWLPWWPFVDWGKDFGFGMPPQQNGGSAIITLQFVEALRDAAELESALGDRRIAGDYRKAAARAATAVRKLCWDKQYGLIADELGHQHFSQHANILAVWLDIIPRKQQKEVLEKILSTTDTGFSSSVKVPAMTAATYYFRFYLARALLHAGMGDEYLQLLRPWREMVSLGLTTWAESPEPTRSDSHAWSAHPNFDLLTIVAGIRPAAAGFKSATIEPHLGELQHLEAAMPVQDGSIEVNYQRLGGKGLEAKVTLPVGMTGSVNWKGHRTRLHSGQQTVTIH